MKIKKYLAILLSSAMVLQMSVMAFAGYENPDDHYAGGSPDSGYVGKVLEGDIIDGSTDSVGGGSGSGSDHSNHDFSSVGVDTGTLPGHTGGSGEQEIEQKQEDQSEPQNPVDEKKDPEQIQEEPSEPQNPVDEKKDPEQIQEEPSEPQNPVDEKKDPEQIQEEPSEPQNPVDEEIEPEQIQEEPSEPQNPVEEAKEPEQIQEEPSEPQEPSTPEPQVSIVSTAAGNALPTSALGNAIASTKSVSLDLYNIEPAQYVNYFTAVISSVPQNGQAVIALNKDSCLNRKIVDEIAARSDVTVNIIYKDKAGITKLIVIPAGANLSSLVDANGYIGFETLAAAFGEKVLQ